MALANVTRASEIPSNELQILVAARPGERLATGPGRRMLVHLRVARLGDTPPFGLLFEAAGADKWLKCDIGTLKVGRRCNNMSRMNFSGYVGHVILLNVNYCVLFSSVGFNLHTYQPDTKSNPNRNPRNLNPNPTTKQHAMAYIQLNIYIHLYSPQG